MPAVIRWIRCSLQWRERGRLAKHEGVWENGRESDEQASKAAAYVCKLWSLARASEGGVVDVPVRLRGRCGVVEGMVRERVSMSALSVVAFLRGGGADEWSPLVEGRRGWGALGEGVCCAGQRPSALTIACALASSAFRTRCTKDQKRELSGHDHVAPPNEVMSPRISSNSHSLILPSTTNHVGHGPPLSCSPGQLYSRCRLLRSSRVDAFVDSSLGLRPFPPFRLNWQAADSEGAPCRAHPRRARARKYTT